MSATHVDKPADRRPTLPRWSLVLVAGLHALIFAWAGAKLPWSDWSGFAVVCWLLALAHLATAAAAAGKLPVLPTIWRVASVFALLVLGYLSWELVSAATYLGALYGELGEGIGVALLGVIGLLALFTLPLAAWGLGATWRPDYATRALAVGGVVLVAGTLGGLGQRAQARAEQLPMIPASHELELALHEARAELIPEFAALPAVSTKPKPTSKRKRKAKRLLVPSLLTTEPVACVPDPKASVATAVVTYLAPLAEGRAPAEGMAAAAPVSRCVQAPPAELARAIIEQVASEAMHGPVKIDVLVALAPLRTRTPILDMLALRPGLDGICDADHCLMPWQLIATDQFVANEPLPWIPDFRFGVSPVALRDALGFDVPSEVRQWDREQRNARRLARLQATGEATAKPDDADAWLAFEELARLETLSYVFNHDGALVPLIRGHERDLVLSRERLERAKDLAEQHIARAVQDDGRFRYTLDPFTGKQRSASWNLPRQAGTTLVMCELGRDETRTRAVATRSLDFMAKHGRSIGDLIALTRSSKAKRAGLGSTALPAIAFFSCRDRVGPKHDQTLAGIAHFLLAMQREDGSFYPELELETGRPIDGPEPMYAGGQAIFALSLAEKLALAEPELGLPDAGRLHAAVERAMAYYTGPYWDTFVRDFFWLEENWHCLAARASLEHHRNQAYEQFCVDYMAYKSRVVLDERSRVAPEFRGGYSVGNILTPVNTPAAGFGEGMAAAMAIKQARGEDLTADRARMRLALEFLVRQQWHEHTCFACAPHRTVVGGFSESMSAPEIRIDYTQHAWAALGHGGAWIIDELPEQSEPSEAPE